MEVAVMAGLFAERDMEIDTTHGLQGTGRHRLDSTEQTPTARPVRWWQNYGILPGDPAGAGPILMPDPPHVVSVGSTRSAFPPEGGFRFGKKFLGKCLIRTQK